MQLVKLMQFSGLQLRYLKFVSGENLARRSDAVISVL